MSRYAVYYNRTKEMVQKRKGEIFMKNYRVDVFYKGLAHYMTEFDEYWLAKVFAEAISNEEGVENVYMLERISDKSFDITKKIK